MSIKTTKRLLTIGEPDSLVFFMGLGSILYGLFLMLPFNTFGLTPAFMTLEGIASEFWWGLSLLVLASTKLIIWRKYMIDGKPNIYQFLINLILAVFWIFMSTSIYVSEPRSSLAVIYPMFVIAHLWIASRRQAALRKER